MIYIVYVLTSIALAIRETTAINEGKWSEQIKFPVIPVAGAILPNSGKLLVWSSGAPNMYGLGQYGQTYSAIYDPISGNVSELVISQTGHDMFCPGISSGFDGRIVVSGGSSSNKTSIYSTSEEQVTFSTGPALKIPRGYHTSVTLSDGRVFAIGGSWSSVTGGQPWSGQNGNKNGEVYDFATNSWSLLSGCPAEPLLTDDVEGEYRSDNHAWLFAWKNATVFQAGPSRKMNWFHTIGDGDYTAIGTRDDTDAMCGNAIMVDATQGKILTLGGAPNYEKSTHAIGNAHLITLGNVDDAPIVERLPNLNLARSFSNAVALPNGQVVIVGGQSIAQTFTDYHPVTATEIWDPETRLFSLMADQGIPRTYHSIALLLRDGTVFSGGGGLCGDCQNAESGISFNHFDGQIYSPPYLFQSDGTTLAERPVITDISAQRVRLGDQISLSVTVPAADDVSFVLQRLPSTTHTVDSDSRRVPLKSTRAQGRFTVIVPHENGVVIPGFYYLFALSGGVPSVAEIVQVQE